MFLQSRLDIQADPDGASEQHVSGTVLFFDSILTSVTFNASVCLFSKRIVFGQCKVSI
jgi:hypothetical protein